MKDQTPAEPLPPIVLGELLPMAEFAEKHGTIITETGLRWLARHRAENGFADAFIRVGKKLLVVPSRFEHCLSQRPS